MGDWRVSPNEDAGEGEGASLTDLTWGGAAFGMQTLLPPTTRQGLVG